MSRYQYEDVRSDLDLTSRWEEVEGPFIQSSSRWTRTSADIVAEGNRAVPWLRSLSEAEPWFMTRNNGPSHIQILLYQLSLLVTTTFRHTSGWLAANREYWRSPW